jgi:3-hydroxyisobutyrate dehydrogenase
VTEQIYISSSSNGLGREDDAGVVRAYLPVDSPSLIKDMTSAPGSSEDARKTSIVLQLLEGIHLIAAVEALALARKCGLDVKYVYEIISNAAGTSRTFESRGPGLVDGSLQSPTALSQTISSLVSAASHFQSLQFLLLTFSCRMQP